MKVDEEISWYIRSQDGRGTMQSKTGVYCGGTNSNVSTIENEKKKKNIYKRSWKKHNSFKSFFRLLTQFTFTNCLKLLLFLRKRIFYNLNELRVRFRVNAKVKRSIRREEALTLIQTQFNCRNGAELPSRRAVYRSSVQLCSPTRVELRCRQNRGSTDPVQRR